MRNRERKRRFGGQSGVIVMNTSDRSKEVGKNRRKELLVEFVHKHCCDKLDKIKKLDNFLGLKNRARMFYERGEGNNANSSFLEKK